MRETREIRVLRYGVEVARQPLDLFLMPDGAVAAKWGGLVFPIWGADCIEVMEQGAPPAQCRSWEGNASKREIVTSADGAGSYIFLEGSAQTCKRVEKHLTDSRSEEHTSE